MNDLISRQAAIDVLERKKDKNAKGDIGGFYNKIIQNDIDALIQLPSAQPEQRRGKWIRAGLSDEGYTVHYRCSCCRQEKMWNWDYCPSCGAKMDKEIING